MWRRDAERLGLARAWEGLDWFRCARALATWGDQILSCALLKEQQLQATGTLGALRLRRAMGRLYGQALVRRTWSLSSGFVA